MATPLDITALKSFEGVFPFLFVLVIVYAILARTWFKDKEGLAALVAVIAALMTLLSDVAVKTVSLMAPWFVLFVIFMLLVLIAFMSLGVKQDEITAFLKSGEYGTNLWVMVVLLIIGIGSLAVVVDEEIGGLEKLKTGNFTGAPGEEPGLWQTVFHPKILGLALVMLLAFFTIRYMTSSN